MSYTPNLNLKTRSTSENTGNFIDYRTEMSGTSETSNMMIIDSVVGNHLDDTTNPHEVTKSQVGLGDVPNVSTNDQTPTFTESSTRANIDTGEKLSVLFGKIKKWYTDLKAVAFSGSYSDLTNKPTIPDSLSDLSDDTTHRTVTDTEKSTWNGKQAALGYTPVPDTRKINNKSLSGDITISASDVGAAKYLEGTGTISTSWSGPNAQGYYTRTVTATGVLGTDEVDITRVLNVADKAASDLIQEAWNLVSDCVISVNTLTFYAAEKPSVAIPIQWKVVR